MDSIGPPPRTSTTDLEQAINVVRELTFGGSNPSDRMDRVTHTALLWQLRRCVDAALVDAAGMAITEGDVAAGACRDASEWLRLSAATGGTTLTASEALQVGKLADRTIIARRAQARAEAATARLGASAEGPTEAYENTGGLADKTSGACQIYNTEAVEKTRCAVPGYTPASAPVERAVRSGNVSLAQAAKLFDVATALAEQAPTVAETAVTAMLAEAEKGCSNRTLLEVGRSVVHHYATPAEERAATARLFARRTFTRFRADQDGTEVATLVGDPGSAAVVEAALAAFSAPQTHPETGARDPRTAGQRRFDALVAICAHVARADQQVNVPGPFLSSEDAPGCPDLATGVPDREPRRTMTVRGARAAIRLVVDTEAIRTGRGTAVELTHGRRLAISDVARLWCDASARPVVLGQSGEVLAAGRTHRFATPAMRAALEVRDGHCSFPGCSVGAVFCDAHHEREWEHGGDTDVANMTLLCGYHHTLRHQYPIHATITGGIVSWDLRGLPRHLWPEGGKSGSTSTATPQEPSERRARPTPPPPKPTRSRTSPPTWAPSPSRAGSLLRGGAPPGAVARPGDDAAHPPG